METRLLTREELRQLHRTVLREAFPPSELKPFSAMDALLKRGCYDAWCLLDGGTPVSWAVVWHSDRCALLDYLVTLPERRGQGLGTLLVEKTVPRFPVPMLVEAEAPEAADPGALDLQERRLAFYRRLGFRDAGFDVLLFGVRYRILVLGEGPDMQQAYLDLYRDGTSAFFMKHHLKVLGESV